MNAEISIDVQRCSSCATLPDDADIVSWVELVLGDLDNSASVSIRLVDELESRELNNRYRQRNAATNVLSFPCNFSDEQHVRLLGDVVVCVPLVVKEAKEQGKVVAHHWAHLIIHGVLHLLGYDHQTPDEAERMEKLEIALLDQLNIVDPYGDPV
jgi:probable rRNA maturation factor